jgi:hypothetical protein
LSLFFSVLLSPCIFLSNILSAFVSSEAVVLVPDP